MESNEAISSYFKLQRDYLLGDYPVGRDDAAHLSALQILVEIGYVASPQTCRDWTSLPHRFVPGQLITRAKREWQLDVLSRYRSMESLTKDDARQQFLQMLRTLCYGDSVFFDVRTIDDPRGLLPKKVILGLNKRGVHFFRPIGSVPKEHLYSSELTDIKEYGSSNTTVFFEMRVAGALDIFQFGTKQGGEICDALGTHINDLPPQLHPSDNVRPPMMQEYLNEEQNQEVKMKEDFERLKKDLEEIICERDKLRTLCDEKDSALEKQNIELEKQNIELEKQKIEVKFTSLEERLSRLHMMNADEEIARQRRWLL